MLLARLDHVHARMVRSPLLRRFTLLTRVLLAVAFLPTGLVKVLGRPFSMIDPATPIGAFFEAFLHADGFYRFVGASQVAAAVLLLIPATAALGAVAFFPIVLNIFVITVAFGFGGTPVVTGLMLLAATWLLAWEWDRLRPLFTRAAPLSPAPPVRPSPGLGTAAYLLGIAGGMGLNGATRGFVPMEAAPPLLLVVGLSLALAAASWIAERRRSRLRPAAA